MNTFDSTFDAIATAWWKWMVASTWQGLLLLVLVAVVLMVWRKAAPLWRYALLLVVLAKFALPPVPVTHGGLFSWMVAAVAPRAAATDGASAHPISSTIAALQRNTAALEQLGTRAKPTASPGVIAEKTSRTAATLSPAGHALRFHLAAMAVVSIFLAWQLARLRRQIRQARRVSSGPVLGLVDECCSQLGLRRRPDVYVSMVAVSPMAGAVRRPFVILPSWIETATHEEQCSLISHELAHLKRWDPLVNWLQILTQLWLWWNPVVWWLNARIRCERELCCDDLLLARGAVRGESYSRLLLNVAVRVSRQEAVLGLAGMADLHWPLKRRIRRVLEEGISRPLRFSMASSAVLALIGAVVLPGTATTPLQASAPAASAAATGGSPAVTVESKDHSLQGTVTDQDGYPVEGARISNWYPFGSNPQETVTDSKGHYRFARHHGYVVKAEREGLAPAYKEFRDDYFRDGDRNAGAVKLDIQMNRGVVVSAVVLDSASRKPLADIETVVEKAAKDPHVGNLPYQIWTSVPARTDANGHCKFTLVPSGRLKVVARSDRYAEAGSPEFVAEPGAHRSVELVVREKTAEEASRDAERKEPRVVPLTGEVKDTAGNPVDAAEISNYFPSGSNEQKTFSDAKGHFRFENERGYVVVARKAGLAPAFHEFKDEYHRKFKMSRDPIQVTLTMIKGGSAQGTVRQADGRPAANAKVWADRWAKDTDVGVNRYVIWTGSPVQADPDGCFRLENLPEGALRLHATADSHAETVSPEFAVADGGSKSVDLKLDRGSDVRIKVTDQSGKPVSGASIRLWGPGTYKHDKTNTSGEYQVNHMSQGEYAFSVEASGYHSVERQRFDAVAGENARQINVKLLKSDTTDR